MNKIQAYFGETWNELKNKVTWPTWEELQASAIVVAVAAVIISALVFVMDFVSNLGLSTFYKMF